MTTPSEQGDGDNTQPETVRVPVRQGDGIWTHEETVRVPVDVARQYDSRLWSDRPPR
ncbi:MAG: hypothetical protein WBB00_20415 [Mycobacterium sp.]